VAWRGVFSRHDTTHIFLCNVCKYTPVYVHSRRSVQSGVPFPKKMRTLSGQLRGYTAAASSVLPFDILSCIMENSSINSGIAVPTVQAAWVHVLFNRAAAMQPGI